MKLQLTLIFISASIIVSGQETKLISKTKLYNNDTYYEEYTVLKSSPKIKHGNYLKICKPIMGGIFLVAMGNYVNGKRNGYWEEYYANNNQLKENGYYSNDLKDSLWTYYYAEPGIKNLGEVKSSEGSALQVIGDDPKKSKLGIYRYGKQTGVWEYYNFNNQLIQKYNYDKDSLVFDAAQNISEKAESYIGGKYFMYQDLYEFFDFNELMKTIHTKMALQTGKISLSFTIDEDGKVKDISEIENTVQNKKILLRAIETINKTEGNWCPKNSDGSRSKQTKKIDFIMKVNTKDQILENQHYVEFRTYKDFAVTIEVVPK